MRLYVISDPSLYNSNCQFVAYQCSSYANFSQGNCADCGSNGQNCRPLDLKLDYWDNSTNQVIQTQPPNQLFIKTDANPPYCLFHYQIVVNYLILQLNCSNFFKRYLFEMNANKTNQKRVLTLNFKTFFRFTSPLPLT